MFCSVSPLNRRNIKLWNFPYCNFNIIESYSDFFPYENSFYNFVSESWKVMNQSSVLCILKKQRKVWFEE